MNVAEELGGTQGGKLVRDEDVLVEQVLQGFQGCTDNASEDGGAEGACEEVVVAFKNLRKRQIVSLKRTYNHDGCKGRIECQLTLRGSSSSAVMAS